MFPEWRRDGREILFVAADGATTMSAEVEPGPEFHPGTPRALCRLPRNLTGSPGITWDFQRYLVSLPVNENATNPIVVVLNWPAALARP